MSDSPPFPEFATCLFLFIVFGFIIFAGCIYAKISLRPNLKVFSGLLWTQALPWTFKMIFLISVNYAIAFEGHLRMMNFLTVEELQQQWPPASLSNLWDQKQQSGQGSPIPRGQSPFLATQDPARCGQAVWQTLHSCLPWGQRVRVDNCFYAKSWNGLYSTLIYFKPSPWSYKPSKDSRAPKQLQYFCYQWEVIDVHLFQHPLLSVPQHSSVIHNSSIHICMSWAGLCCLFWSIKGV